MPVLFDSSAAGDVTIGSGTTSGSKTLTLNVSPQARDRVVVFVAVVFNGNADTSGATFGVTYNGVAMSQIGSRSWDSNKGTLRLFKLEDAPTGSQTVVASFSSMPTEVLTSRNFLVEAVAYHGVDTVGDPYLAGGSSATSNTVVVPSVKPAHRVLSVHGVEKGKKFTAYNQAKRQTVNGGNLNGGGSLLVGDAPGDTNITATATQGSTANWGAIGVALTPSVVEITATLKLKLRMRASLGTFRVAEPHPSREYIVPPIGSADPNIILDGFVRNASGVWMPVWPKDPDDTLEYTLYWQNHLADDDEIVGVEHTPLSGTLRVFSQSFQPGSTQVWLTNGSVAEQHPVRVRFTTLHGRRHDWTFYIVGVSN